MEIVVPLKRIAFAALDLVAPPVCLACPARESGPLGLCGRCASMVRRAPPSPCPRCAAALGPGADPSTCDDCEKLRPKFTAAVAGASYAGFAGELVRRAKYGRDALLAAPLQGLVTDAVLAWDGRLGLDAIVPVPTTSARRRERGFHLAETLAADVSLRLRVPLRAGWLARVGDPPPQAALVRTERQEAARGTVALARAALGKLDLSRGPFAPERAIAGRRVLVVDDVLTTGATVNECARVLLTAGAKEVRVAVAARA